MGDANYCYSSNCASPSGSHLLSALFDVILIRERNGMELEFVILFRGEEGRLEVVTRLALKCVHKARVVGADNEHDGELIIKRLAAINRGISISKT